jgi:chemotaxis signal transduction protein
MAIYKGITIDDDLASLMRHMQGVEEYREVLGKLQAAWDTLTLLGQLTGAAAEMSGTREAFQGLTGDLLNHLGRETRNKSVSDLRSRAQNAIDILVRNLFERTADIGFIAADDDVREFLLDTGADRMTMEERFREYVAKYSVYSDIVLFTADGDIRARLGEHTATASSHELIGDTLRSTGAYVEYFGAADFLPPGQHLIYAWRVMDTDGAALGVLALVFRLTDESRGIYRHLLPADDWTVLACVTAEGTVIASSSTIQVPVGAEIPTTALKTNGDVVRFGGREYLAVACNTQGYQGYMGPGWRGVGLIPLEFAFNRDDSVLLANVDKGVLDTVMHQPTLFADGLREIPRRAERIQQDLNRSVWNGSVRQIDASQGNAAFAKTLLWEISNAGRKTQAVFEQSIGNLHQTVVAAILQNTLSRASFAIDVMDRNLYERANDCRWWALNATFRRVLNEQSIAADDAARCADILAYINNLYTVYENLVLFDARGTVIAVSRDLHRGLVGQRLDDEWVSRTLSITSSQGYVVSDFVPTRLYGGRSTYIYAAAVRDPANEVAVGGIAIVFDAAPQFSAMLTDALPRDGEGQVVASSFAVFVDAGGRVLVSSADMFAIGSLFPVVASGGGTRILAIDGRHYAIGTTATAGYREFKCSDGYRNDVVALCGFPLGDATALPTVAPRAAVATTSTRRVGGDSGVELATFHIGQRWLAIPASQVIEAIDTRGLTPPTGAKGNVVAGFRMFRNKLITVLRLDKLISGTQESDVSGQQQIVVVKTRDKTCLGLLVDSLGEIPEVARDDIQDTLTMNAADGVLVTGIVRNMQREGEGDTLLSVLDVNRLCSRLGCRGCDNTATESSLTT